MPVVFANILKPIIDVCEQVLLFFHDTIGVGWGLSIILLTVTVRVVLLPLTLKQFHSMQRLQAVAPEMKKIQERYKEDKQRQQQEMMRFYRENKINPAASCLPLLFQLPFFFALYYMLRTDLRQDICGQTAKVCGEVIPHSAEFLFVNDLTAKATGATLAVLVVLYITSQLGSGLLSSATMDKNQRMLMLAMPIVFVTFIVRFPAGLLVYWITTNLWTIVQQLIVRRTLGPLRQPSPVPAANGAVAASAASPARSKASSGNGGDAAPPTSTPPPSPRKKKKRSGRRR